MQQGQQINLEPAQIIQAATAGLQLLNTPGAVNVPGPMALTDAVKTLNALLTAIANGQLMLVNAPSAPEMPPPPPSGDQKPDLKQVVGKKE